MKNKINIGDIKHSIKEMKKFQNRRYEGKEIEITNMHLMELNKIYGKTIFRKDDLFVHAVTLFESMQKEGDTRSHNAHNLSPEKLVNALRSLHLSDQVVSSYDDRYIIVSGETNELNEPIIAIIEIGASLINNRDANINKLVTIYPKRKLVEYLKKLKNKKADCGSNHHLGPK